MARLQLAEPGGRRARHFLKKGDIVRYEKFGLGVVTEDEHEGMVSASFDGQVKRLSLQYAPIVRVSGEDERERRESTFHQETDDEHPVDEEFIDVTIRPELRESMSGEGEPPKKMSPKGTSMLIPVE